MVAETKVLSKRPRVGIITRLFPRRVKLITKKSTGKREPIGPNPMDNIIGIGNSSCRDGAINHDKYLAKDFR